MSIIDNNKLPFLRYIASCEKKAECRVASEFVRNWQGDFVVFKRKVCALQHKYLHYYNSLEEMLVSEGIKNMVPLVDTHQQALQMYCSFFGCPASKKLLAVVQWGLIF